MKIFEMDIREKRQLVRANGVHLSIYMTYKVISKGEIFSDWRADCSDA